MNDLIQVNLINHSKFWNSLKVQIDKSRCGSSIVTAKMFTEFLKTHFDLDCVTYQNEKFPVVYMEPKQYSWFILKWDQP